jgi:mono/diheme cytochrome c family protein
MASIFKLLVLTVGVMIAAGPAFAGPNDVQKGHSLYLEHCASCHGMSGEGNGPLAPGLTVPPSNLRKLSERYGNPLPADEIARFIDGRAEVRAHGPRDMPVWGKRFYSADGRRGFATRTMRKLVAYLQSIQLDTGAGALN